ncbi:hypothetical protein NUW54_g10004 [Trametes sanguinea]|uniref:Uncharacterized protein n=1 Tax=Trametes sanguinea TaxID=158606 RepID=A0ACC1P3C4_9APHY|nr:hypothetical protein NUW54_g10004 [Trametes sanguinea]
MLVPARASVKGRKTAAGSIATSDECMSHSPQARKHQGHRPSMSEHCSHQGNDGKLDRSRKLRIPVKQIRILYAWRAEENTVGQSTTPGGSAAKEYAPRTIVRLSQRQVDGTNPATRQGFKVITAALSLAHVGLRREGAEKEAKAGSTESTYRAYYIIPKRQREHTNVQDELELPTLNGDSSRGTPVTLSAQSSRAPLHVHDPREGATIQELPPVDRGVKAWTFCFSAFVLEMMVWGFGFSYDYYTSHPPFDKASGVAISAVGTVSLAIQYGEVIFLSFVFGRYPDFLRIGMWAGLTLYFAALFCSSFATEVWQLILLQGVGVGFGGGLLYMPVIKLLPEWFSERRGLAGGIIFAGTGVGGFVFPFILNALLDKVGLRWTLRIWAIGTSLCSGIALLGMRSRFPIPKYAANQRRPRFIPPHVGFITSPLFWTFAITNLLQGLSYFPVSLYIATFTRSLASQLTATVVLALFNSSAVAGQIILGHLSDRFPYPVIMVCSALGSALAAFFLWGFANAAISSTSSPLSLGVWWVPT